MLAQLNNISFNHVFLIKKNNISGCMLLHAKQYSSSPQWCSSSPFIAQGGKTVYKKVLPNIPFQSMGIFPLIWGG